jgi:uncharacterized protein YxjI
MEYVLKQKIWSFGDDFVIKDRAGNTRFWVDGKVFSWGDKLQMNDADGHEVAYISQKLISLRPSYTIYKDGEKFAEVRKDFFSFIRDRFTLDVPGPNDYHITGSFLFYEYTFKRNGREVASASKKYIALSDSYGVRIAEGEDDVAILATCVVIDMIAHDDD